MEIEDNAALVASTCVGELGHCNLGGGIAAFLARAEDVAEAEREGGGGELDLVFGGAGEVYTVERVFGSLGQGEGREDNGRGGRTRNSAILRELPWPSPSLSAPEKMPTT